MATQVQFRRGTTAQNNSFTGVVGEVSIDTDKDALRIHDGTTSGGFEQAKADLTNVSGATNLSLSGITTTNSLSIGSTQVISSARQLQNIASLDATTTATIESAIAAAPNDFTSLNISGVSTFSGITTHTTSLFGTQASFSGVITATTFVGALTGTASSTTNIPNLTGAITSNNTTTSLGSFTSAQLATALTDETGSGAAVFATSPTLVTPALGTPSSGTLTSCTGLPVSTGISGLAANVATFLATPSSANFAAALTDETGSGANVFATSPTLVTPVLGAASATSIVVGSGVTINASGIVASAGIITATTFVGALTGTASNVTTNANLTGHVTSVGNAAVLGSFTSLQLLTALTDETGTGANVFATSPILVTPALGTPSSGTLTSCTGLPLTTGVTGTLPVANGGTGVTGSTGTGSVVLSASPTFTGTVGAAAITATGDIAAANFNSTSDISLKENIKSITNPLDKVIQLNGVTFNWKENQKPSIGVIAQELEKVLPELVTQGDVKSVNYNGIIGVLIEAIKEQQKQIEELKSAK